MKLCLKYYWFIFFPDTVYLCLHFIVTFQTVLLMLQGEDNLMVPIHAFPVLNTSEFPKFIDFSLVPIGETYVAISSCYCSR